MKIRNYVFGSGNEKELFNTLKTHWAQRFDLYPSLPFASIIDIDDARLSDTERSFLYKTSVDYTLCTKQGKPLVSVEFDGLGHGFSQDGKYIQIVPSTDQYRKLKLDLKLRLCKEVGYPLFVVSYDEKVSLGDDITLTIVDGLIGQVLAKRHFLLTIAKVVEQHQELLEGLPPDEQHEYIQDLVSDAGAEAELTWDPIAQKAAQLQGTLLGKVIWKSLRHEYLHDPELPGGDLFDVQAFKHRVEALKHIRRVGCKVTLDTPEGKFSETAWVRNFQEFGVSPTTIAENIASLILFRNILNRNAPN